MTPYFNDNNSFILYHGDSNIILDQLEEKVDMIFADPPYFLSGEGISCSGGKMVSVKKGDWEVCSSQQKYKKQYN